MSSSKPSVTPFAEHLFRQYDLSHKMVTTLADDFTAEEARQSAGGLKPLVWYLGHLAVTKTFFLGLYAGHQSTLSDEHMKRYNRGSDPSSVDFSDADKDELLALLKSLRAETKTFILSLTPEDLAREAPTEVAHPLFKTLGSALALVCSHDAYHAGQIGALRRAMGKDPLFG